MKGNKHNQILHGIVKVRNDPDVTAANLIHKMAIACGVRERDILSKRRDERTSICRQGIMLVLGEMDFNYTEIGQRVGNRDDGSERSARDHSTVIYGIRSIRKRLDDNGITLESRPPYKLVAVNERRYGFPTLALCSLVEEGREQRNGFALRRGNTFQRLPETDLSSTLTDLTQWAFYVGEPVVEMEAGKPAYVYRPVDVIGQGEVIYRLYRNGNGLSNGVIVPAPASSEVR